MKKINYEEFSYYRKGAAYAAPSLNSDLWHVYAFLRSFRLKALTLSIRKGEAFAEELPSVAFSGVFPQKGIKQMKRYSSLICINIENVLFPESVKRILSRDNFLNPVLIFVSPKGNGLSVVIRVEKGKAKRHNLYYEAAARHIEKTCGVRVNPSCRSISHLCFICHDPEPFWFEDGFVKENELIKNLKIRQFENLKIKGQEDHEVFPTALSLKPSA